MKSATVAIVWACFALAGASFSAQAQTKGETPDYPTNRGTSGGPTKSKAEVKADRDAAAKSGQLKKGETDLDKTDPAVKASKEERAAARKAVEKLIIELWRQRANLPGHADPMARYEKVLATPSGVEVAECWQGNRQLLFLLNHTDQPQEVRLDGRYLEMLNGTSVLAGTIALAPRDIVVLMGISV